MGTLVSGSGDAFRITLDAVGRIPDAQGVVSTGHHADAERLTPLPPNVVVVSEAPQIELLKCASLGVTHAGLNTVLEALSLGVPMAAGPVRVRPTGRGKQDRLTRSGTSPDAWIVDGGRTVSGDPQGEAEAFLPTRRALFLGGNPQKSGTENCRRRDQAGLCRWRTKSQLRLQSPVIFTRPFSPSKARGRTAWSGHWNGCDGPPFSSKGKTRAAEFCSSRRQLTKRVRKSCCAGR